MHQTTPPDHPYRHHGFFKSFLCALKGLWWALSTQRNLRRQLAIGVIVLAVGGWVQLDGARWGLLFLTIVMVMAMEVLNTALETLVDSLYPDYHQAAALVKDVAAGATLLAALGSIGVGVAVFWNSWPQSLTALVASGSGVVLMGVFARLSLTRSHTKTT